MTVIVQGFMFSLLDMLEKLGLSVARQGQYFKIPEIAWGNTRRTAAGDTIAEAVRKCQEAFGAAPNIIFVNLPTNGVALYQVIVRPQCAHRGIISLGHMHACKLWHAACRHESMHKDLTRGHICSKIRILQSENGMPGACLVICSQQPAATQQLILIHLLNMAGTSVSYPASHVCCCAPAGGQAGNRQLHRHSQPVLCQQ